MVVYGEGYALCPEHGPVRPAPRVETELARGNFEPLCPMCNCPLNTKLVDEETLQRTHDDYAARRSRATVRREGAQASGGVGGTRIGVKCLHAHLANFLVGADDPVGALVANEVGVPDLVRVDVRD